MATTNKRTGNYGGGKYGTRKRDCACGRRITVGGPFTQHTRRCAAAQEVESEREAVKMLRDLGSPAANDKGRL